MSQKTKLPAGFADIGAVRPLPPAAVALFLSQFTAKWCLGLGDGRYHRRVTA
ncbi:hypothetical protein GFS31_13950 [Leptolyngbya sp. BL0902]|uniref:hypothetical protein n=1 Tax=Leptolyngbya sp. BL0902 TaxID=1115757 RepID=UPI0018E78077|nr:hypothetical protein [Leptolyngbya sp. BL0902]QQE64714.1 hypothetical protein GFS31_13950 [Leptolyngbya sp. BL0902]